MLTQPDPIRLTETLPAATDPDLLVGVDGGGSKTTALLADTAGQVLGRGSGGPSNVKTVGEADALATVRAAIRDAYAEAQLPVTWPRAACLGLAGLDRPEEQRRLRPAVEAMLPGVPAIIVNDVELVLAAGTPEGWGIGVIAGTGAIALGCTSEGRTARVSGWGWAMGDEGSGYALGQAALRAVARAADGRGARTALTAAILRHWSLATPEALLGVVYQTPFPRAQIAALATLVEAAAGAGDEIALQITRAGGRELALAALALARALEFSGPIPGALAGGVLVNGQGVRRAFVEALEAGGLRLDPMALVAEPAQGAVALARRLAAKTAPL